MPVYFSTDIIAQQEGWIFTTPIEQDAKAESNERYHTIGECPIHGCRAFFQTIFLLFLRVVTVDFILECDSIRIWNEELERGTIIEQLFFRHLAKDSAQPLIRQNGWGWIDVETVASSSKHMGDVILLPGSVQKWDWNWNGSDYKNQMHHLPGIRQIDIDHLLLTSEPDVVILSKGRESKLNIDIDIRSTMKKKGIELHVLKTEDAIVKYNALCAEGTKRVAALIHTTC